MNNYGDFVIIIDTREQLPLTFSIPTERGTLTTGDYSVKGLEDYIAIERKSIDDLVACLKNGNRDRFERELARGRDELEYFALVVESDMSSISNHRYASAMCTTSVIESLSAFSIRYRLPVFFCENRRYAARLTESLLQKYVREVEKQIEITENE